jgi:hypothetical protein
MSSAESNKHPPPHPSPTRGEGAECGLVREKRCAYCAHFRNDPKYLEAQFAGLTSLGSAYASVRAEDGLCLKHDCYLRADSCCADFAARCF